MAHQINGIALPNEEGFFGQYGGQFIPPDLKQAMDDINVAYQEIRQTEEFQNELKDLFAHYVGRPSPLFHAKRLSEQLGGAQIYLPPLRRRALNATTSRSGIRIRPRRQRSWHSSKAERVSGCQTCPPGLSLGRSRAP